jgi:molybdopterin-binding protein
MNSLTGVIVTADSNGRLWRVKARVRVTEITAVLLDFAEHESAPVPGKTVTLLFKEAETALALDIPAHSLSIRNRLPCHVVSVEDDGILANVKLDFSGSPLCALITSEAAGDLTLSPGKMVNALIKSTEVMIETGDA